MTSTARLAQGQHRPRPKSRGIDISGTTDQAKMLERVAPVLREAADALKLRPALTAKLLGMAQESEAAALGLPVASLELERLND